MTVFAIVGHIARTDGGYSLNDLPGSGGRMDVICRCVNASFFLSHDLRRDVECYLVLCGAPAVVAAILGAAEVWVAEGRPLPGRGTVRIVVAGAPPIRPARARRRAVDGDRVFLHAADVERKKVGGGDGLDSRNLQEARLRIAHE